MMILSRMPEASSEFLGMKERVYEVETEQHGDAQANDRFGHVRLPLETRTGARIEAHQRKENGAEAEEDEIEHVCLLSTGYVPETHKDAIPNFDARHKQRIKSGSSALSKSWPLRKLTFRNPRFRP
jgi:hypothetical protein